MTKIYTEWKGGKESWNLPEGVRKDFTLKFVELTGIWHRDCWRVSVLGRCPVSAGNRDVKKW